MCNHVLSTSCPPNRKCVYGYLVKFSSQSCVYRLMRRPSTAHQSPSAISHTSPNATDSSKYAVARFTSIALNVLPWTERHSAEPAPSVCLQNFTPFATCLRLSLRHSHTSLYFHFIIWTKASPGFECAFSSSMNNSTRGCTGRRQHIRLLPLVLMGHKVLFCAFFTSKQPALVV
jgi:hypothetical protein